MRSEQVYVGENGNVENQRKQWIEMLSTSAYSFHTVDFQTQGDILGTNVNLNKAVVKALQKLPVVVNETMNLSSEEYYHLDPELLLELTNEARIIIDAQILRMKAKGRTPEQISRKIAWLCNTIQVTFKKIDDQLHTRKIDVPLYIVSTELVNFCASYSFCRKHLLSQFPGYLSDGFINYGPDTMDQQHDANSNVLSQIGLSHSLLSHFIRQEDRCEEEKIYTLPQGGRDIVLYFQKMLLNDYHEKIKTNVPVLKEIFEDLAQGVHLPSFTFVSSTGVLVDVMTDIHVQNPADAEEMNGKTFGNTILVRMYRSKKYPTSFRVRGVPDQDGNRSYETTFDPGQIPVNEVMYNFREGILELTPILQQANLLSMVDVMSMFPGGRALAQRLSQEIVDEILRAYLSVIETTVFDVVPSESIEQNESLQLDQSSFVVDYTPYTAYREQLEMVESTLPHEGVQDIVDGLRVGVVFTKGSGIYELVPRADNQTPLAEEIELFEKNTGMPLPSYLTLRKVVLQNKHSTIFWEDLYKYLRHFGLEEDLYTADGQRVRHGSSHKKTKRMIYKQGKLQEVSPPRVLMGEIPIGTLGALLKEIGLKKELFYYVVEKLGRITKRVEVAQLAEKFKDTLLKNCSN